MEGGLRAQGSAERPRIQRGRPSRWAFGLRQLAQTELVASGSAVSCSFKHTAQVTSIWLGWDIWAGYLDCWGGRP